MKKKQLVISVLIGVVLIVLLPLAVKMAQAQGAAPAEKELSIDQAAPQEVADITSSAFTYQGRLVRNGTPVSDTCDFIFSLWSDPLALEQVGLTDSQPDIPVTDGYFSVLLNSGDEFGTNPFDGEERYLAINVDCRSNPGWATLSPRIPISPAPYALGLRPGAVISGTGTALTGYTVSSNAAGGMFKNMYGSVNESAVGVWAGSYYGDIIQGHELNINGTSYDRRFRVTYNGNVYADGTYYGADGVSLGAADFAEMVLPGQADLEPGDVLSIGPDGQMVRSTESFQATVVGVYSTEPGFIAGNKLDEDGNPVEPERIPLAVVGIVPVKASAENGPIVPGDLLVASDTPGHAMRAGDDPPNGTVVGKALSALDSGTGVIQMLVMLQ